MSNSKYGFDDWVKEARHVSMLYDCIEHPLRPGLDELVKADETAKMLRDKMLSKLTGTLPKNDCALFTWSNTVSENFMWLAKWIKNYTLGFGIGSDWDLDETIKEMQKMVLAKGVDETFARNALNPSSSFWKENEEYYKKERERKRAKAEAEKQESVRKMLADGLPIEIISKYLGLTVEEINEIKKKVQ